MSYFRFDGKPIIYFSDFNSYKYGIVCLLSIHEFFKMEDALHQNLTGCCCIQKVGWSLASVAHLQALQPVEYAELQAKCEESQKRGTIEANLDQLKGRLAAKGVAGDLSGRPKNLWGVYSKMRAKGYGLDKVYDVRALRVVVDSKSDCYEVLREVRLSNLCDTYLT